MASGTPPLVLQAVAPVRLGLGCHLIAGERLTVQEGDGLGELLADLTPSAQRHRFGKVLFHVVTDDTATATG